ncbi:MAG TPA: hypothetical protein VER55_14180 [Ardenticatenaceae bacterium]|nr:hypothetical protein [Ardenticatenaceae bacterium]
MELWPVGRLTMAVGGLISVASALILAAGVALPGSRRRWYGSLGAQMFDPRVKYAARLHLAALFGMGLLMGCGALTFAAGLHGPRNVSAWAYVGVVLVWLAVVCTVIALWTRLLLRRKETL